MKKTYSHSEIVTFLTCPRKYAHAYIDNLELRKVYFPFIVGSCIHLAITVLYQTQDIEAAVDTALKLLHDTRIEFSKDAFIQEKDEIDFTRSEVFIESSIRRYYSVYAKEISKFEVMHADEIIEHKLLKNTIIKGHPDMILRRKSNNKIYIYEIKTASSITKEMIDRYFYDFQTNLYILLTESKYPISGVYFDAIKKPSIRLKKAETEASYLSRLRDYYVENLEDELFYRDSYIKNPNQLKETINTIKYVVYNINRLKNKDIGEYPMNRLRCYDFFSTCEYLPLCNYGKTESTLKPYTIRKNDR